MTEAGLQIRLFGPMTIRRAGQVLPLRSRKAASLLALLLLRPDREVQREWLAETLWPDYEIENRQMNLRQRLADVRKALGDDAARLKTPTSRTLCFDTTGVEVDALAFDRAAAQGDPASLRRAIGLYTGPFLEDSTELWVLGEREHRQQAFLKALETVAVCALADGDVQEAIETLQKGVHSDLWHQSLHRLLMQIHAEQGDFDSALRIYAVLSQELHQQHNAAPEIETRLLYQELRARARRATSVRPVQRASRTWSETSRQGAANRQDTENSQGGAIGIKGAASSAPADSAYDLPIPLTPLIGRERELREIQARLLGARLLTLTGIGGTGKTRLAVEAGLDMRDYFPDGVFFADLSGVTEAEQVPQAVAAALKLPAIRGKTWREGLQEYIGSRHLLLIMDNCEHLQQACLELIRFLLQSCLRLRLLATSRQAFRMTGEAALPVLPLPLPPVDAVAPERLAEFDSICLFMERAQAVLPDFTLTEQNAPFVVRLCHRLDGLPLALEIAAGLLAALSLEEIDAYLAEKRLELHPADTTLPSRHRSLRAMLAWSFRLLTPTEQRVFARLSVFAGGFTRQAAEAISQDTQNILSPSSEIGLRAGERLYHRRKISSSLEVSGEEGGGARGSNLEILTGLITKSLVVAEQREGKTRYRLLETVREFAAERLEANGEAQETRQRHLQFYSEMAFRAEPGLTGPEQAAWIERLEQDHANLRAALQRQEPQENWLAALRMANALGRFWQVRGYFAEGRETLERLLVATEGEPDSRERAYAMTWAGILAVYQSDYEAAYQHCRTAREICEALNDLQGLGGALGGLGMIAKDTGDLPGARLLFEESLLACRKADDRLGEAGSLGYLGIVASSLGDVNTARVWYQESLAIRRELQDAWGIAASLNNLALLARQSGENEEAKTRIEESIAIRRLLVDRRSLAISLNVLGEMLCEANELERARELFTESLALCQELGDRRSLAFSLEHFALLAGYRQQNERAARLYGGADSLREQIKAPLSPGNRAQREKQIQELNSSLGEAGFQLAYQGGQNMELEALLEEIRSAS